MIRLIATLGLLVGAACAPLEPAVVTRTVAQTEISVLSTLPQPQAGQCWAEIPAPTKFVETTETVLATPARIGADGAELHPAIYRKEIQTVAEPTGPARWFERVCPDQLTPTLIEDLQRALSARGLLSTPATGVLDPPTLDGLLAFQTAQGLESDVLSIAAARQMGLVAVDLDSAPGAQTAADQ